MIRRVRELMPTGGGLRDEDWQSRHRLLTRAMIGSAVVLTGVGLLRHRLDVEWVVCIILISICTLGALRLPPRRLPSSAVALGLTAACAETVMMFDGLTEAHFTFFIAVGALALYRDWVPFGVCLVATVAHHAFAGMFMADRTFDHMSMGTYHESWVWALVHGAAVLLVAGTQVIAWRLAESEERRASEDLTQAEAQVSAAFEQAPVAMLMMAPDGRLLRANPAFTHWLGLPAVLPARYSIYDLPIRVIPPGRESLLDRLREGDDTTLRDDYTYQHENGTMIHVDLQASAIRDSQGRLRMVVKHFIDVTEQRMHEAALRREAREDSLTRLLNRGAFESDLGELIEARTGELSVIFIDVDRFKAVNDSHGHGAGDEVLRTLGLRLAALAPHDALVARLGADEFAVVLSGPSVDAERFATTIVQSCEEPFLVAGGQLAVTVSIGICTAVPGEGADATLQSADMAMYAAKQAGRDRIKMFDDTMRLATQRRVAAEQLLRAALDGERAVALPVWFQPIVSLSTRRIIGAEALVRLRTGDGDLVAPGVFIQIAEETGLVIPLGQHVLRTALSCLQQWGDRLPYVSVNVSPRQLSEVGFVPMLVEELAVSGLKDTSRLVLEITETSMLQSTSDLRRRLDAIKELGVRLALDDFGTGYSSLTWLQSVPADIVKLDRSFVAGLATDPDKAAIISAVLWLAKALGMSVIAEGVEEVEDADMLAEADCPAAQGYLFSRPVGPGKMEGLLDDETVSSGLPLGAGPAPLPLPRQLSRTPPTIATVP